MTPHFIEADWPAPAGVLALSTTRRGGCSTGRYASLNLAQHVGDDAHAVAENRAALAATLPVGTQFSWLSQVHGRDVAEARNGEALPDADAQWTRTFGMACAVMTADCLPVLFCDTDASVVGAAHAGWRGLLAGVLEATVQAMQVPSRQLLAWMGPAIGPAAFEVGDEVRQAFLSAARASDAERIASCFTPSTEHPGRWMADIYALARTRLAAQGVTRVYGGHWCTHRDSEQFFSYRRDGETGRMASLILLR
jgi:YfiH family protein